MGLAGAVQAHFIGFIAPDNYLPILTFQVWAMLIVGGSGNNRGAILGAVLVWGIWALSAAAIAALFPPASRRAPPRCRSCMIGVALCADPAAAPARHSRRAARRLAPSRQPAARTANVQRNRLPDAERSLSASTLADGLDDQPPRLRPVAGRRHREGRHDARSRARRPTRWRPMPRPASTPSTWPITTAAPS